MNLDSEDPRKVLFVVSCTKRKIWDEEAGAPRFVPARYAYRGEVFRKFIQWAERNMLEKRGFKWIILSAKYGFIEPWHPVSNYDITFEDENTGPITAESLYNQVMFQNRWGKIKLKNFKRIIFFGSSKYREKILRAFKDVQAEIIDGFTGEALKNKKEEECLLRKL